MACEAEQYETLILVQTLLAQLVEQAAVNMVSPTTIHFLFLLQLLRQREKALVENLEFTDVWNAIKHRGF